MTDDVAQKPSTWEDDAAMYADGAERARLAGDHVAMIALLTAAANCIQVAKQLRRSNEILREMGEKP